MFLHLAASLRQSINNMHCSKSNAKETMEIYEKELETFATINELFFFQNTRVA